MVDYKMDELMSEKISREERRKKTKKVIGIVGPILSSSGTTTHVKNVIRGFLELDEWTPILITYMEPNASVNIVEGPFIVTNRKEKPTKKTKPLQHLMLHSFHTIKNP